MTRLRRGPSGQLEIAVKMTLAVLATLLAVTGCGGTREVAEETPTGTDSAVTSTRPSTPVIQRRIVLYEPRSDVMMILVNAGHTWRRSPKGRLKLAMGTRNRSYKVFTEKEMDALIESFQNRAVNRHASDFLPGDERYFTRDPGEGGYRGILYLEEGRRRRKVLAFRPHGEEDLMGHARYKSFVDLKGLVYRWYNARSESESAGSGVTIFGSHR